MTTINEAPATTAAAAAIATTVIHAAAGTVAGPGARARTAGGHPQVRCRQAPMIR